MKALSAEKMKRIITVLLTIVSCLLLFANWIVTKGETRYDWSEFRYELQEDLEELESVAGWFGIDVSTNGVRRLVNSIIDGKFSPADLVTVSVEGRKLIRAMKRAEFIDEEDVSEISSLRFLLVVYVVLFFLIILCGIYRIFVLVRNDPTWPPEKKNSWSLFILQAVHLILAGILCLCAKKKEIDLELGLTMWPFIACICAVSFSVIDRIPNSVFVGTAKQQINETDSLSRLLREMKDSRSGATDPGIWDCPECGKKNEPDSLFCSKCGKQKPEKPVCRNCGAELDETDAFCKKCGTRVEEKETTIICPFCGVRTNSSGKFCEYCGAKLERAERQK